MISTPPPCLSLKSRLRSELFDRLRAGLLLSAYLVAIAASFATLLPHSSQRRKWALTDQKINDIMNQVSLSDVP